MAERFAESLVILRGNRWPVGAFAVRFVLLAAAIGFFSLRATEPLAQMLLPLFRWEIQVLDDTYRIDGLYVDQDGADRIIRIDVGLAHSFVLNGRTFYPDPRGKATASTLVGNVTLSAMLIILIAMVWPARNRWAYTWRALALMPALLLMWMLDVPMILWAMLWNLHVQVFDPHRFSPLLIWSHFLHSGGRLALALAFGAMVGSLGKERSAKSIKAS